MEHLPKLHVSAEHHGVPPMRPGQIILILLHHVRANDRTIVGVPDTCEVGQTKPRKAFVGRGQSLEIGDPKALHETLLARTFFAGGNIIVALKAEPGLVKEVRPKGMGPAQCYVLAAIINRVPEVRKRRVGQCRILDTRLAE